MTPSQKFRVELFTNLSTSGEHKKVTSKLLSYSICSLPRTLLAIIIIVSSVPSRFCDTTAEEIEGEMKTVSRWSHLYWIDDPSKRTRCRKANEKEKGLRTHTLPPSRPSATQAASIRHSSLFSTALPARLRSAPSLLMRKPLTRTLHLIWFECVYTVIPQNQSNLGSAESKCHCCHNTTGFPHVSETNLQLRQWNRNKY